MDGQDVVTIEGLRRKLSLGMMALAVMVVGCSAPLTESQIEATGVAHEVEVAGEIMATAEALTADKWVELQGVGFPEKAMNSALKLIVCNFEPGGENRGVGLGSGTMFKFLRDDKEYFGILTAKHVLEKVNFGYLQVEAEFAGMTNSGGFYSFHPGVAVDAQGADAGVLVFDLADVLALDPAMNFGKLGVFELADLAFEDFEVDKETRVYGVGFPGASNFAPHVFVNKRVWWDEEKDLPFEPNSGEWSIEEQYLRGGASGTGLVTGDGRLLGWVISYPGGIDVDKYPSFFALPRLGEERFMDMLERGLDNYEARMPK